MKRSTVDSLYNSMPKEGTSVQVCGWTRTVRDSKNIAFMDLNDGSCFKGVQVVFESGKLSNYADVVKLNVGAAVVVEGNIVYTPNAKQPFEINAENIIIEGESAADYPLQKKRHSVEFLRTLPHLRARTNLFSAAFRVRSEVAYAIHKFFHDNGFVYVHTPIITDSDTEGAGAMFRVSTIKPGEERYTEDGSVDYTDDFFARQTNLTVSGQLEAEGMALAFGNVYTFGPTFRAENSNTPRHAAEFWMIEPEIAFADLSDDMDLAEAMVKSIVEHVLETCKDEISFFNQFVDKGLLDRLTKLVSSEFVRISYTKAVEILKENNDKFQFKVEWGADLQTEHERYLTEEVYNSPVFVTDYPKEIKSFYMRLNDDDKTVAACDMLVPGVGELIGGSQREERYDVLKSRMESMDMDMEEYGWFLDLRRFGSVKHAGFGLGFERMVMYVTGIANIRDVLPFPRTAGGF